MPFRSYNNVCFLDFDDDKAEPSIRKSSALQLCITDDNNYILFTGKDYGAYQQAITETVLQKVSSKVLRMNSPDYDTSYLIYFSHPGANAADLENFSNTIELCKSAKKRTENRDDTSENDNSVSVFDKRTELASAAQYFQFYGYLSQQQNMMQDFVRTSTYQRAIHANLSDFHDKVVLDVGAGTGLLSFFAVQAGARRVYAVEASSVAVSCAELVHANNLSDKIVVIAGRIEDINIPEEIDVIISEPMGYMLINERMLESYIHSRKFLKPSGRMFPSKGDLHIALFSDEALYIEQCSKSNFWYQENFHGINLAALHGQANTEIFKQPVVDTWHINILMSGSTKWSIDFQRDDESTLHNIIFPFELTATRTGFAHGLATWFDVSFIGSTETVWLSTAPTEPLTHWYQVRCLFNKPLMVFAGQTVRGCMTMTANERQSYDVVIAAEVGCINVKNCLDLKNPLFRYTATAPVPPVGFNIESPSDVLLQQNVMTQNIGQIDFAADGTLNNMNNMNNVNNINNINNANNANCGYNRTILCEGIPPPVDVDVTTSISIPVSTHVEVVDVSAQVHPRLTRQSEAMRPGS